jgi:hypothetical protein
MTAAAAAGEQSSRPERRMASDVMGCCGRLAPVEELQQYNSHERVLQMLTSKASTVIKRL